MEWESEEWKAVPAVSRPKEMCNLASDSGGNLTSKPVGKEREGKAWDRELGGAGDGPGYV